MSRETADPAKVLVIGGGVAALEFVLALRKLAEDRVRCTLVCPEEAFAYRPASVAVPFGDAEVYRFPIDDVAATAGADWRRATVERVDPGARVTELADGTRLAYDRLVVATGARRVPVLEGAITFRGEEDVPAIEQLLSEMDDGTVRRVAFALPTGATWPLPLYELALLTSARLATRSYGGSILLAFVTPEDEPLAVFGGDATALVRRLFAERGVRLYEKSHPAAINGDTLVLVPPALLHVDRVVAMPAARGRPITGLPHDFEGFLPVDGHGRVVGVPSTFALGDATSHPIKQGGIAAQQADVVAQLIAHEAGAPVDPPPRYTPTLRGLMLTGDEPQYLEAKPTGGHGTPAKASTEPLWWPGGKIAAPHLGSYLVAARR